MFVRHGQSQGNATGIIADGNSPLTESGIEQARKTASEERSLQITMIVSSPFIRAQQTAEIIAGELGIDIAHIKLIDELRERNQGALENNPKEHDSPWYYLDHPEVKGLETRQALFRRMQTALATIKRLSEGEKLLVVGHAISGFYLLQIAARKASFKDFDEKAELNNADFTIVEF